MLVLAERVAVGAQANLGLPVVLAVHAARHVAFKADALFQLTEFAHRVPFARIMAPRLSTGTTCLPRQR